MNLDRLDPNLVKELIKMRDEDPDAFMRTVLKALKHHEETALLDTAETGAKLKALDRLIDHFSELEEYEECLFLTNLKRKIVEKED